MTDYGNYTTYHFDDVDEMSDYESTGAPPPPPPEDDYDKHYLGTSSSMDSTSNKNNKAIEEVPKDLESEPVMESHNLNTTMNTTAVMDDEDYEDIGEDESVEIPPTKVVEDMMRREQEAETDKGGSKVVLTSAILCILISLAVILGAGFGTGAFDVKANSSAASNAATPAPSTTTTLPPDFQGDERPDTPTTNGDAVDQSARGQTMREFLSSISLAGSSAFSDLSSPESLALQWLVLEDPLQLDASKEEDQFQITQRYALVTLWYNSDFTWANETGWLKGDECTWYGVSCMQLGTTTTSTTTDTSPSTSTTTNGNTTELDDDGGAEVAEIQETAGDDQFANDNVSSRQGNSAEKGVVTAINLEGNNIQGNIPRDLALLQFLTSLNLSDNVMDGDLPAELTQITTLQELLLDRNLFSMDLSSYDFSPLVNLQLLDLSSNSLMGSLPSSLWTLANLELLVLDNNAFTGSLSNDVGQLTKLTRFTAGNNQLSGEFPEALGQMANLQVLWLFMNQFSGELLQTWSMPALQVLDIYDNQFTGSIPEAIAALPNLAQLVIGANRFSGPIPDAIGESMTQLSVLNIEDCMLEGAPIPDSLSNLGNLTILRLGNNANVDSADIPAFVFQDFPNLQELRLPGLKLTGDLTNQTWANLRRLRIVDLSNNDLEGFPDGIVVCRNLEELNLSENNLGGNLPDDIDDLARLKQLFLSNAGLIGNLTESVGNLAALEFLDLSNNTLLGTLPDLGGMTNAQELKFSTNFFTGGIPESVGRLRSLQVLDLSTNFLGGTVPDSVGDVESLVILKLGDNANEQPFSGFSGPLPTAFSQLSNLAQLELFSNRFTGTLPAEWGQLDKLQVLDVEFNPIVGTVPADYGGMTSLREFYISNTDIEGAVPEEACVPTLNFFVTDCDVVCTCCSRCVDTGTGATR